MPDLICPFCKSRANFTQRWTEAMPPGAAMMGWDDGQAQLALQCDNSSCLMIIGGILGRNWRVSNYWPRSYGCKAFPDVPEYIGAAAGEAHLALSVGAPRAAIAMARSVVEASAKNQGIEKGNLMEKVDALAKARVIAELMREAAHEIRFAGNEIAHWDLAQESITTDDAKDVLDLMDAMLLRVYQEPAQVERVRDRRKARTGT